MNFFPSISFLDFDFSPLFIVTYMGTPLLSLEASALGQLVTQETEVMLQKLKWAAYWETALRGQLGILREKLLHSHDSSFLKASSDHTT